MMKNAAQIRRPIGGLMITDLVCKMPIDENTAPYSLTIDGEMYFFCSDGCRAEFSRRPQDYLDSTESN